MAVVSPGPYLQGGSHSAQSFRQVISALCGQDVETFAGGVGATGPAQGLARPGHLAVSEKSGTPTMSVDVAAGLAFITGDSSLAQGAYVFLNDATENLAIATADASNARWDLVVAQVRDDTEDAGGYDDHRLAVVTGTPAASPADPTVPAGCLVLARVVVAALASSITNANVTALAKSRVRPGAMCVVFAPSQTLSDNVYDALVWSGSFQSEDYGWINPSSQAQFKPDVAGWYWIGASVGVVTTSTATACEIRKNGTTVVRNDNGAAFSNPDCTFGTAVYLNGTTDYATVETFQASGSPQTHAGRLTAWLISY